MGLNHRNEKLNVLRLLIENLEKDYSIRQISLIRKINYKTAYEIINKLKNEGIINLKRYGNTIVPKFNFKFNESVFIVENQRKIDFLKNKDFKVLYQRIKEIKNPFFIALVFGSHAKNIATRHSDLDLCVIANDSEIFQEFEIILNITPFDVHFFTFTSEEFIKMLKTTEFNVGKEIVKHHVILKGIEEFYELIENAK